MAVVAVVTLAGCDASPAQEPAPSTAGPTSAEPGQHPSTSATQASSKPKPKPKPTTKPTPKPEPTDHALAGSALAAARALPVKGRAPRTGYDRDEFGQAWADVDHNGCDTRNDILGRDLVDAGYKPGTRECVLAYGTLQDSYSGHDIDFVRGQDTSSAVQIDHVVALSDAWQKGAQKLTAARREAFANDPLNLLAADGPLNQAKGDGDAATWLPPNKAFRCDYVARQVAVKRSYGLWVTQAEQDAMVRVLATCPKHKLPKSDPVPGPGGADLGDPPPPADQPEPVQDDDVYYQNCDAVRAAGADPIYAGDPGYSRKLDRDGDGVACE
ncbi:MAG: DUF1524 domain-containing protein [Brevundimonas sp.]